MHKPVILDMADSGRRDTLQTGVVIDAASQDKCRPDLISPFAAERLGNWLALGAKKYAPRNWENGIAASVNLASLERHLMLFKQGDRSEDHLAAVMCRAMFMLHFEETEKRGITSCNLLDLPMYMTEEQQDLIAGVST